MVIKKDRADKARLTRERMKRNADKAAIFRAVKSVNENPTETCWIVVCRQLVEISAWDFDKAIVGTPILVYEHGRFHIDEFMDKDGRYIFGSKAKGNTALNHIIAIVRSRHE